ncbi:MAG: response regulator [Bacteroidota bacterium]
MEGWEAYFMCSIVPVIHDSISILIYKLKFIESTKYYNIANKNKKYMIIMDKMETSLAVVLLVEDNPADQQLTIRAFRKGRVNTNLQIASDGVVAMEYLRGEGKYHDRKTHPIPDLILLDINMPRKDGKQVLKEIREDKTLKIIPVVMLTTSDQEKDVVDSYNLGVNAYISKPVRINEFLEVVNKLEDFWFSLNTMPPKIAN